MALQVENVPVNTFYSSLQELHSQCLNHDILSKPYVVGLSLTPGKPVSHAGWSISSTPKIKTSHWQFHISVASLAIRNFAQSNSGG